MPTMTEIIINTKGNQVIPIALDIIFDGITDKVKAETIVTGTDFFEKPILIAMIPVPNEKRDIMTVVFTIIINFEIVNVSGIICINISPIKKIV
ncbi:hypothetical protein CTM_04285 [Clostridium tetanomorphum DSM 665]|nr:hypothetical protein CTM_26820 [Clostridium tetanomorphum DSM 665]KAJ53121.1 hypothetical protein CTM_04285 [Clostridium tetanomorphum DSM 665]